MNKGQPPASVSSAVAAALREPILMLGAGVSVCLFLAMGLVPLFGVLFGIFTPLPLLVFYCRRGRVFGLTMIGSAVLGVTLIYSMLGQPLGVFFFIECCVLAVVLGEGFRLRLPPEKMVGYPAGALLALGLAVIILTGLARGQSPWTFGQAMVKNQLRTSFLVYESILAGGGTGQAPGIPDSKLSGPSPIPERSMNEPVPDWENAPGRPESVPPGPHPEMNGVVQFLIGLFPGLMLMSTLFIAWANFMLGRLILVKTGWLPSGLTNLKTWSAPEKLIWVLIAAGFAMFAPLKWLRVVALNGLMVLSLIYFFHGLCVVAFWLDSKKASPFLRIAAYTLIALQQYLALMVAALGLFDMWLDFRKIKKAEPGQAA